MDNVQIIAEELSLAKPIVKKVLSLFAEGNTVPFIARYRKEATGGLDEVDLRKIKERDTYLDELLQRKETVTKTITDQGKMTPALQKTIRECLSKNELEEIYLPFKPKKRTRATIARERGLEPLALKILEMSDGFDPFDFAVGQMAAFKDVKSIDDAIAGANDIISELGGEVVARYALLGDKDLVFIVNLPGVEEVFQASIKLHKLTGIAFSSTPAITVEKFDKILS